MKTLLDLSLDMQVPIVNGLCFSRGSAGDLAALSAKLAASATDMAAMREGGKESYTGESEFSLLSFLSVFASPF